MSDEKLIIDGNILIEKINNWRNKDFADSNEYTDRVICDVLDSVIEMIYDTDTIQPHGYDKDRLIEELKKCKNEVTAPADFVWNNAVGVCIATVEEQPTTDGWIPVSERLPEVKKMVLVTYRHTQGFEYNEIAYRGEDGEWYSRSFDWLLDNNSVIAWQPLPLAYKESEEE